MIEDFLVPALRAYMGAPQSVKSTIGWLYGRLPRRIRFGGDYPQWLQVAQLREPAALARDANERLARTLAIALETVPAYRSFRHLSSRLDEPHAVLAELPIIDKTDIKRNLLAHVSTKLPDRHRLETFTGGSTANPMRFYLQRHVTRVREYAFMDDFHARAGMHDDARVLALRGRTVPSARAGGVLWMHEPIKNQLILSSDHLQPEYMSRYVAAMRRWRPEFVQAFPSALYPLAKWLAQHPAPDITTSVRGVMLYSETTYPHQLELFRQVFDHARVLMHYGHSERCVMAATIPGDDRYFFWPQYGHLELIDEQGCRVTTPGKSGEIVCTSFDNEVMPFVRYRTGDRGALGEGESTPLPGFPILERIEGRLQEMVQCSDGRLISITTLGAAHFNELASVTAIQFEQHRPGELVLNVETATPLSVPARRSIEQAVRDKTQDGCNVQVVEVPAIPRTAAGKQLMLLQRINLNQEVGASTSVPSWRPSSQNVSGSNLEPTVLVARHGEPRRPIVMISTALDTQGGIAAVLSVYATVSGFLGHGVNHLPTHCDGSKRKKFRIATRSWLHYLAMLLARKVRLLHVHSSSGPSFWRKFMFVVPTLVAGRPVVLHWHGGRFVDFYNRSPNWQQRIIAWTFARSARVIALSAQWNKTLSGMFPAAHVITIPNPVDVPAVPAPLDSKPQRVLFLGRIVRSKGVHDLLEAWKKVLVVSPDAQLILGGDGDIGAAQELAAALGIESNVKFAGWVDGATKLNLLQKASAFALPSHAEAMPMAVLEAMAWGLPIVATNVGGIPHAVRDGEDGLLVDVGDVAALGSALTALLTDHDRRAAMGASARRRVESNFSAELIVPRIKQVWREVLAERGDFEPV